MGTLYISKLRLHFLHTPKKLRLCAVAQISSLGSRNFGIYQQPLLKTIFPNKVRGKLSVFSINPNRSLGFMAAQNMDGFL